MGEAGGVLKCGCTGLELIWKAMESHSRILERDDVVRGWPVYKVSNVERWQELGRNVGWLGSLAIKALV